MHPVLFSTGTSDTIQKCVNDVHCYHYLEKPYNEAVLVHAMKELLATLSNTTDNNYLTIKLLNDVTTHVCLSNILLIKANGHYLTFTCPDGGFTSNTYSLSSIAKILPSYFTRSSSADDALRLSPPRILSLEQALDFIDTDELLEVTPKSLRIRKKILDHTMRKRAAIQNK